MKKPKTYITNCFSLVHMYEMKRLSMLYGISQVQASQLITMNFKKNANEKEILNDLKNFTNRNKRVKNSLF